MFLSFAVLTVLSAILFCRLIFLCVFRVAEAEAHMRAQDRDRSVGGVVAAVEAALQAAGAAATRSVGGAAVVAVVVAAVEAPLSSSNNLSANTNLAVPDCADSGQRASQPTRPPAPPAPSPLPFSSHCSIAHRRTSRRASCLIVRCQSRHLSCLIHCTSMFTSARKVILICPVSNLKAKPKASPARCLQKGSRFGVESNDWR